MGLKDPVVALIDSDFDDCIWERAIVERAGFRFADARENAEAASILRMAAGAIVQYTSVDEAFLSSAPNLRAVSTYGVGTDHIDLDISRLRGIEVLCVADYCTQEVADHTLALVLALIRRVFPLSTSVHDGHWATTGEFGNLRSLGDCTYSIIGFGRIGQAVAQRVAAFGARVLTYDPYASAESLAKLGVESVSLEQAFEADIISIHMPLTRETRGLINYRLLDRLPQDAVVVNVSRGEIVDQVALATAIAKGKILAALDVLQNEPPLVGDIENLGPNTIVTPHAAWFSPSAERRVRESAATQVVKALAQIVIDRKRM